MSACVMGGGDGDGSRKGVARSRLARSRRARRERKYQNRRAEMIANPAIPPTTPPTMAPVWLDEVSLCGVTPTGAAEVMVWMEVTVVGAPWSFVVLGTWRR